VNPTHGSEAETQQEHGDRKPKMTRIHNNLPSRAWVPATQGRAAVLASDFIVKLNYIIVTVINGDSNDAGGIG